MDFWENLTYAWINIKNNSLRTWLTMLGIFLGIATIVSLISLGQGLQDAIVGQFSDLGADKITFQNSQGFAGPPGSLTINDLTDHDLNLMKDIRGFEVVTGRLIRFDQIEFRGNVRFTALTSLPNKPDEYKLVIDALNADVEFGRVLRPGERSKVMLGYDYGNKELFARKLQPGDKIQVRGKDFEVVGILEKTGSTFGEEIIIMPVEDMQEIFSIGNQWDLIVGQVQSGVDPKEVSAVLTSKIRRDRNIKEWEDNFQVQTPEDIIKTFGDILLVVQAILVGIASISLMVGGIGIMNTMYTSVLERTKEIGILKSIGARNSDILAMFLVESGLLGLVGGIIGLFIGIGFSLIVEYGGQIAYGSSLINASFPSFLIIGALLFSFIMGSMAGTFPALQAAKLKPVDALRFRK